jgi:hypothetical protein
MTSEDKLTAAELLAIQKQAPAERRAQKAEAARLAALKAVEEAEEYRRWLEKEAEELRGKINAACQKAARQNRRQAVIFDRHWEGCEEYPPEVKAGWWRGLLAAWEEVAAKADPADGLFYATTSQIIKGAPYPSSWDPYGPRIQPDVRQMVFYVYWDEKWRELRDFEWEKEYWRQEPYQSPDYSKD